MKMFGYVRVSSKDQNPERQLLAIRQMGIHDKDIFVDRMSGGNFDRPAYKELMKRIRPGDHIVIKSIDRLGRNYSDILEQWRFITLERKASIEVLDMPLLNTGAEKEGLTGKFISDLVLQILAYVAETERSFIRQRQAEGIAAAMARGIRFGRERVHISDDFDDWYVLWLDGKVSMREAAVALNISPSTFCRRCKEISSDDQ
ncbi:MAG: recombinase family protein [Lachnospiraceae bacterium]|nr:recombinase family protein [Lachnospiraceae bacterium]